MKSCARVPQKTIHRVRCEQFFDKVRRLTTKLLMHITDNKLAILWLESTEESKSLSVDIELNVILAN